MKQKFILALIAVITVLSFNSCAEEPKQEVAKYPEGAIVWAKGTTQTITNHFIVQKGQTLFVEEGVTVVMNDTTIRPEIVVLGNMVCKGTATSPIKFTVAEQYRTEAKRFARYWGGIICGYDSEYVLLDHVIVEYCGAQTTETSASFINGLFKTVTGEGVPAFHFCNTAGRFVVQNSTFRNNAEDHIYITGGKSIIANNKFYANGFDGGEAINYKSGCLADVAFNLIYDANSNALKLSNNGALTPQSVLNCYNNTIVNCGWRRPKVKGGSVWLEYGVIAKLYNNLIVDARWAVKRDTKNPEDEASVLTPNFFYASTEMGVNQYKADVANGQIAGANDVVSLSAGDKNPNFEQFTQQSSIDINAGSTGGAAPVMFSENWDFHLKAGSPALSGGNVTFNRNFATQGIEIDGVVYTSPAPVAFFGAYGKK